MKAIELKGLDQTLYYEKLENGLEVYMLPYKNKSNYTINTYIFCCSFNRKTNK